MAPVTVHMFNRGCEVTRMLISKLWLLCEKLYCPIGLQACPAVRHGCSLYLCIHMTGFLVRLGYCEFESHPSHRVLYSRTVASPLPSEYHTYKLFLPEAVVYGDFV